MPLGEHQHAAYHVHYYSDHNVEDLIIMLVLHFHNELRVLCNRKCCTYLLPGGIY